MDVAGVALSSDAAVCFLTLFFVLFADAALLIVLSDLQLDAAAAVVVVVIATFLTCFAFAESYAIHYYTNGIERRNKRPSTL